MLFAMKIKPYLGTYFPKVVAPLDLWMDMIILAVGASSVSSICCYSEDRMTNNDATVTGQMNSLALLAHALISKVGSAGSQLRTNIHKAFVDFIFEKTKTVCSEVLESLPSVFCIEVLLMTFHLSSEDEKVTSAKYILSSVKGINALPSDFNSIQLNGDSEGAKPRLASEDGFF
ncbi:hypothetical protein AgCh_024406 [Apium graveolens]